LFSVIIDVIVVIKFFGIFICWWIYSWFICWWIYSWFICWWIYSWFGFCI